MPTLWFIVPAHGRHQLTAICLRQLRRTCDRLTDQGVEATAVVVACDDNLDTARELGFGTIERDNQYLSRKYNDGIQLALDPDYNPRPADYVVPCGSDDWVHHGLFRELPRDTTMIGFQQMCFVREDGRQITARRVGYPGGCGIRIYPRQAMEPLDYRPADEDRARGCDTSILYNVQRSFPLVIEHRPSEPWQIVDWKTAGQNVTPYSDISRHPVLWRGDPFTDLAGYWPADTLEQMQALYVREPVAA